MAYTRELRLISNFIGETWRACIVVVVVVASKLFG